MRKKNQLTPFGKAVKKRAISKCLTLAEVAEAVGTSPEYLCYIMYGVKPGLKYRRKIGEVLGIDVEKYTA
jgi:transcriptional regulator with XRE-family HTH domain